MSLSSGPTGGKGVDSNAVDTYDSGDEWDIGVGNLIIDLDADLEKDKLEMSSGKEGVGGGGGGGNMAAPPTSAVAALPDNIKFVSPVATHGKESKSKSKRSKNSKESAKAPQAVSVSVSDGGSAAKKDIIQQGSTLPSNPTPTPNSTPTKGGDKSRSKSSRALTGAVKKDKEGGTGKSKKDKMDTVVVVTSNTGVLNAEKESAAPVLPFEGQMQNPDLSTGAAGNEQQIMGNMALDSPAAGIGLLLPPAIATEQEEEVENNNGGECRSLKKVVGVKIESPVSTPTAPPPPLHLPAVTVATNNNNSSSSSSISLPCEQMIVRTRSVGSNTADVSMGTEPECLGPCEPGTSVNLEGIVWQETEDGMLVVNVTWRNKTYVGTLLDCTRHDWAPPRFCESPTSDIEMRSGRGRGKRMRPGSNTPVNDNSNSSDNKGSGISKTRGAAAANNSKGRRGSQTTTTVASCGSGGGLSIVNVVNSGPLEETKASPSSAKRKAQKTNSDMEPTSSSEDTKGSKRMRTNSTGGAAASAVGAANVSMLGVKMDTLPPPPQQQLDRTCSSPVLIDCPHPNCNKKYKHINGLKYHQARAHNDHDVRIDQDMDSEYGDDSSSLHPDTPASCNGANSNINAATTNANSPARSTTPKGRGFDVPSPSPGKKGKKKLGEVEVEIADACEENACLTDEASSDGIDDRKAKKLAQGGKAEKLSQKGLKPGRPGAQNVTQNAQTSPYAIQANSPALGSIVVQQPQPIPKSPQLKTNQPNKNTTTQLPDPASSPTLLTKEKKKKDKKKRDSSKEADSPKGKGVCEAKSPYSDTSDSLLNGSNDPHQSRLASIKAEADKVYSFSDNAPSPSIGVGSRMEGGQNGGADNASVKTSSPAYSDISDAGEDGEGKADTVKVKTEPADPAPREGAKKALFPPQPPGKDQPYYPTYDCYYSPTYPHPSPGNQASTQPPTLEGAQVKKEEEEHDVSEDNKLKMEPADERKPDLSLQHHHQHQQQQQAQQIQASVIQQRPNMYNQQPLYYNQYYVPPYSYTPDQAYHAHLLASNPAYRQQYEERKKSECKEVPKIPPTLSRAPSLTDLKNQSKSGSKESAMASTHNMHSQQANANANSNVNSSEQGKPSGVIMAKGEESGKGASATVQPEGLKMKLSEAVHHGKDEGKVVVTGETGRPTGVEQAMWYRQEPDSRLWPYVYPNKYSDAPKPSDEDRWKEERERERERERDRERERKTKEERQQHKPKEVKEEAKELALSASAASADDQHSQQQQQAARVLAKEQRPPAHMQFPSAMAQHQGYMPYMHHGPYAYSHAAYEPTHPGYRGMPSVMMAQNYPASYLPPGYSFPSSYGGKVEESDKPSRSSPTVKQPGESKALDLLQQHASQYKSKSPSIQDNKQPHERERDRDRDRERERDRERDRERERERDEQRPRSSPSQRIMQPSHHHLGYPLLSGQYDLSYASGLSSSAIVASQQASAPSMYPPPRR